MKTENLGHLCVLIIEDLYGSFLAHIFRQLAYHGRLISQQLAQRCHLSLRLIRTGLAALVQLQLVQHYATVDGFSAYQANLNQAYSLLRVSKLSLLARKSYGPTAAAVVEQLGSMGFSTAIDLVTVVEATTNSTDQSVNDSGTSTKRDRIIRAMKHLAHDDFFVQLRPAQFQIYHDARQDADDYLVKNPPVTDSKLKGKKAQEQHVEFVNAEMDQRLDSHLDPQSMGAALDAASAHLNGTRVQGSDVLYIGINHARGIKASRDRILSDHVGKTFGDSYADVANVALSQIDLTVPPVIPSGAPNPPQLQLLSLSKMLQDLHHQNSSSTNGDTTHTNGWHHDEDETMANGTADTNGDGGQQELQRSLESLAEGPYAFLRGSEEGAFSVDCLKLRQFLVRQEILKVARQRIGLTGVRLMRMLIDKGRLDEKVLQELGLLNAKEMRKVLADLHGQGFVELQEVPKDPQRQPNRTMFLWFYDEERARKVLVEQIYKSMARLYQRLQLERDQMKVTLDKIEKKNCEGQEAEIMYEPELVALGQYRRKERWLLGEISRLDDSVAVLRDL